MTIAELRIRIDDLDRQLVELLNERARAAQSIGRLKRHTSMPIYEPDRERTVFENIARHNRGPLPFTLSPRRNPSRRSTRATVSVAPSGARSSSHTSSDVR